MLPARGEIAPAPEEVVVQADFRPADSPGERGRVSAPSGIYLHYEPSPRREERAPLGKYPPGDQETVGTRREPGPGLPALHRRLERFVFGQGEVRRVRDEEIEPLLPERGADIAPDQVNSLARELRVFPREGERLGTRIHRDD